MGIKLDLGLGVNSGGKFYTYQAETRAFFTATGITSTTHKKAVDYLVKQLKANSLYTKFSALYPFVGGTADTHKIILINPADSDAAFRIAWSGSVTHDANGIKGNGTNAYGDTKLNLVATSASLTSFSLGLYKKVAESAGTSKNYFGAQNSSAPLQNTGLGWLNAGSTEAGCISANTLPGEFAPSLANAAVNGSIAINCNGNRNAQFWANGSKVGSAVTQTGVAFSNLNVYILCTNFAGSPGGYTANIAISLAYISTGLSNAEMATLHTIVTAYQTMLGRN